MQKARATWPELDILRGFAVVLMILNHAGVLWLAENDRESGLSGWLVFLGGFAPVVFFFVTGLGYGLAHRVGHPARNKDVLIKAGILILADVFMRGGSFLNFGWDFLAFIGMSMLALHAFRGRRHGVTAAVVALLLLLILRYAAAPIYMRAIDGGDQAEWIRVALGIESLEGVSYWFTPWLCFSLGGFLTGVLARRFESGYLARRPLILLALAMVSLLGLGAVAALEQRGLVFHRWGTMSVAFFVATVPMLLLAMAGAGWIAGKGADGQLTRALSLRGISSLAVVPIHYALLRVIARFANLPFDEIYYLVGAPLLIVVCFQLARLTDRRSQQIARAGSPRLPAIMLVAITGLGVLTTAIRPAPWNDAACFAAGLLCCVMLAFSYSQRAPTSQSPAPAHGR